jgi:hypothetical protein
MNHRAPLSQVRFQIDRLEAWAPDLPTATEWQAWAHGQRAMGSAGEPALSQMAPMLRRHAGRLGRLACDVAYRALGDLTGVPVVFCSRYGEIARSVELLSALASGADLSPTSFGLSVHNAIGGLFSMARRDTSNCLALSAGDESAEFGLIEACSLLADGVERVLLVVAELPLPGVYASYEDVRPAAFAWACIVTPARECGVTLSWRTREPLVHGDRDIASDADDRPSPGALEAVRYLLRDDLDWGRDTASRRWQWHRDR